MEKEKSAGGMWKQIFQIQKYDLVNEKLKWNIDTGWEINTLKLSKTAAIKLLETIQTALEETYNNIDLKTKTLFAHYEKF